MNIPFSLIVDFGVDPRVADRSVSSSYYARSPRGLVISHMKPKHDKNVQKYLKITFVVGGGDERIIFYY